MISHRQPPAYQMYASDRLADRAYRAMSATERGVLHTIELECWVSLWVPRDTEALARVLGLDPAEVVAGLTERVLRHLDERRDDVHGVILTHPELDAYRARLDDIRRRQSEGGQRGTDIQRARAKNRRRDRRIESPTSVPVTPEQSRAEQNRAEQNPVSMIEPVPEVRDEDDEWGGMPEFLRGRPGRIKPGIVS